MHGLKKNEHFATCGDIRGRNCFLIETKGMPATAKKFVDEAFDFFDKLADSIIEHRLCTYKRWESMGYRCVNYKKKYIVAYMSLSTEVVICDFVSTKLLKE